MIELLSSQRMVVIVIVLTIMCLLILILEGILTEDDLRPMPHRTYAEEKNLIKMLNNSLDLCYMLEEYYIKEDCSPCTKHEINNKNIPACTRTGFKQLINCAKSGDVYKGCYPSGSSNFWKFEITMIIFALIGAIAVKKRGKYLDLKMADKLRRQLEAGV